MTRRWNDQSLFRWYERVKEYAKRDGFSDEDLSHHYLDKLNRQTKSARIKRMIKLAYYLGWLRGIASVDMGKTPITLRTLEDIEVII